MGKPRYRIHKYSYDSVVTGLSLYIRIDHPPQNQRPICFFVDYPTQRLPIISFAAMILLRLVFANPHSI